MLEYVRGFLVLFVLLQLLLYLPPGKTYQKYIRFFAELILTLGLLSPVLSFLYDSEEFLAMIDYEEFTEEVSQVARDMERMEYINNEGYLQEYERAIAEDVRLLASQTGEAYGYQVQDAQVSLGEDYTITEIRLWIAEQTKAQIVIGKITPEDDDGKETEAVYAGLIQKLSDYYQVDTSAIEIRYAKSGAQGEEG